MGQAQVLERGAGLVRGRVVREVSGDGVVQTAEHEVVDSGEQHVGIVSGRRGVQDQTEELLVAAHHPGQLAIERSVGPVDIRGEIAPHLSEGFGRGRGTGSSSHGDTLTQPGRLVKIDDRSTERPGRRRYPPAGYSAAMPRELAIVLAGGEGKRLMPLTLDRAKPAVPFAGHYRLVDFALSNLVNAGFLKIVVLTQYKSHSLDLHISRTWRMSTLLGNYVTTVPAQMRRGRQWFAGSADAVFQNLNIVGDEKPDYICVFGADHIYRMDPRQMLQQHVESGAGVTVAGIRVDIDQADQFGVIEPGEGTSIHRFLEKPRERGRTPRRPPGRSGVDGKLHLFHARAHRGPGR